MATAKSTGASSPSNPLPSPGAVLNVGGVAQATGAPMRFLCDPAETLTTTTADTEPAERSLKVCIRPIKLGFWEFEGTRAQLEAENVIPPNTKWPDGTQDQRWEVGRFRYWLRRRHPGGMKGPWASGDWWCLRCELTDSPDPAMLLILDLKRELAEAVYRQTPAGQREWSANFDRYWAAREDKAYQAFKAVFIPVRKKPGRKPKAQAM